MREGDQNNSYFYRVVKGKISKSIIQSLLCSDGNLVTDDAAIKNEILGYYKGLLGTTCVGSNLGSLQCLLPSILSDDMKEGMITTVNKDEIYSIIKVLPSNKSPGPDDFTAEFFKSTWSITGDLVVEAVHEFFETRQLLKELNCTLITLVPKC